MARTPRIVTGASVAGVISFVILYVSLALGLAVLTGLFVALYTTYDAYGIRATADPFTFLAWFFMIDGLFMPPLAYLRWELALLEELGFGLDLARCAVTGTTDPIPSPLPPWLLVLVVAALLWTTGRIGFGTSTPRSQDYNEARDAWLDQRDAP